jgi:PKD repeat protein
MISTRGIIITTRERIMSTGATCDKCDSVHVGQAPVCNAEFMHYTGSNPDSVHFYPVGTPGTHYYWDFGDGTTSTYQDPWHFYFHSGTYQVCLTIIDSATQTTCTWCDYHVIALFHSTVYVSVNPNPTNGYTFVTLLNLSQPADMRIYNFAGQIVYEKKNISDGIFTVSTQEFLPGVYYYTVGNNGDYLSNGKLIVVH